MDWKNCLKQQWLHRHLLLPCRFRNALSFAPLLPSDFILMPSFGNALSFAPITTPIFCLIWICQCFISFGNPLSFAPITTPTCGEGRHCTRQVRVPIFWFDLCTNSSQLVHQDSHIFQVGLRYYNMIVVIWYVVCILLCSTSESDTSHMQSRVLDRGING